MRYYPISVGKFLPCGKLIRGLSGKPLGIRYPKGRDRKISGERTSNGVAGPEPVRRQGLLVKNVTADSFDSFFLLGPPRFDAGRMIKQGSL